MRRSSEHTPGAWCGCGTASCATGFLSPGPHGRRPRHVGDGSPALTPVPGEVGVVVEAAIEGIVAAVGGGHVWTGALSLCIGWCLRRERSVSPCATVIDRWNDQHARVVPPRTPNDRSRFLHCVNTRAGDPNGLRRKRSLAGSRCYLPYLLCPDGCRCYLRSFASGWAGPRRRHANRRSGIVHLERQRAVSRWISGEKHPALAIALARLPMIWAG
jgi:hypothetical protein